MPPVSPCTMLAEGLRSTGRQALSMIGEDLTPAQAAFRLPHGTSSILWLTGHLAVATGVMAARAVGTPRTLPARFSELFDLGAKVLDDPSAYPPLSELRAALSEQTERVADAVAALDPAVLETSTPPEIPVAAVFPTVGRFLAALPGHTMYHCGQITLLRRAQGLSGGFGM